MGRKDGGYRPLINLKMLNQLIPFLYFKMEGLSQLKHFAQEGDSIYKLDLKDLYFSLPLDQSSSKFARFLWKGTLYEFLYLCFGLGSAPQVFTKLLGIPISSLRKINIRVKIYSHHMMILIPTIQEAHMSRVIYLLQNFI